MRALTVPVLFLACMADVGTAEELGEARFSYTSEGPVMELALGHLYSVGTFSGTLDFVEDNAILEGAVQDCMGYADLPGEAAGYCIITATNGDRLFVDWLCGPNDPALAEANGAMSCSHIIDGGTGAFEDATGTAVSVSVTTSTHPNGRRSGYDTYSSFDLVLGS